MDGAVEALASLRKRLELVIVTSRDERSIGHTHIWLDKHFPGIFRGVEFVALWSKGEKVSKALVCQQLGARYLVDDNADHCRLAAECGTQALLFGDTGWNRRAELSACMVRCKDWPAVLEYFDGRG
jgi:FMN phosphatase YigB (HAD superfamily)